jgi:hypothetical protein
MINELLNVIKCVQKCINMYNNKFVLLDSLENIFHSIYKMSSFTVIGMEPRFRPVPSGFVESNFLMTID